MRVYKIVREERGALVSLTGLFTYEANKMLTSDTPMFAFKCSSSAKRYYYLVEHSYAGLQLWTAETEEVHVPPSYIPRTSEFFNHEDVVEFWRGLRQYSPYDLIRPPDGTVLCYDLLLKEQIL